MEISFKELMCSMVAVDYLREKGVQLNDYRFICQDEGEVYVVSAIDEARPPGFRGSRQGFPQPIIKIQKGTNKILEVIFTR
jgi:hypothetical protein